MCVAALVAAAVQKGDALAAVLAEKGEPRSRLERGSVVVLTYGDGTVRLENGVVVAQTLPSADYAVHASPVAPRKAGSSAPGQSGEWTADYPAAVAAARGSSRHILLFFTGSDWCGWCRKLKAEVLDTETFRSFAGDNLVLVELDFPRRIAQPDAVKQRNQLLQQKYGIRGYPTIVVLDDTGAEVGRLGYQPGGPGAFLEQLRRL